MIFPKRGWGTSEFVYIEDFDLSNAEKHICYNTNIILWLTQFLGNYHPKIIHAFSQRQKPLPPHEKTLQFGDSQQVMIWGQARG